MSLEIKDFSPFVEMTEGEFFLYFKDKCKIGTPIKDIYRKEKKKYTQSARKVKRGNKQRKETKPDSINS